MFIKCPYKSIICAKTFWLQYDMTDFSILADFFNRHQMRNTEKMTDLFEAHFDKSV